MKIRAFKDSEGLQWNIKITAGSLLKACRKTGLTLSHLTSLDVEVEMILAALPFFCDKQLSERKMSHEDFLERLGADEMQSILTDLFPSMADAFSSETKDTVVVEDADAPKDLGPVTTS